METIRVGLGSRSYDILVGDGCLVDLGQTLRKNGLVADTMVFTSPRIGGLYYERLRSGLDEASFPCIGRYDIPDGEENKDWPNLRSAVDALAEFAPRKSAKPLVINLGGGVVSDLGGFAAGIFQRGVEYVQVPTTLLACVDSGVGGKVGVNFHGAKNLVGMIWQPRLVFVDLSVLKTLELREIRSGVAEVIKYGAVCSRSLFAYLEENIEALCELDVSVVGRVVRDCYRIKAKVVMEDERDTLDKRIVLNFGHTIGHALEMASGFRLTHGEGVAVGMVGAARLAIKLGVCDEDLLSRLTDLIRRAGLPPSAGDLGVDVEEVLSIMQRDKKFINGTNRFVLPVSPGDWCIREGIDNGLVREATESCLVS